MSTSDELIKIQYILLFVTDWRECFYYLSTSLILVFILKKYIDIHIYTKYIVNIIFDALHISIIHFTPVPK